MSRKRNSSGNYETVLIVFKDGTQKLCKSRWSYHRWLANNDTDAVKYVKYKVKGKPWRHWSID